jgi:NAD(P)H dehydrogenase (quinone)
MTILVTGGNGQYGRLVVRHLLHRVDAAEIAVSVREPERAADLAALGIQVRRGDFADPASMLRAFDGVDSAVLVSVHGTDEQRLSLQLAAVRAATQAGVGHLAYTSMLGAPGSPVRLAVVHAATEDAIAATGVRHTFLRNGLYAEPYLADAIAATATGVLASASDGGRVSLVSRDDLAEAAAVVLTTPGHPTAYELTGPAAWSYDELAALVQDITRKPLAHKSYTADELLARYLAAGLPPFAAELLADVQNGIGDGRYAAVTPDLRRLLGRSPVTAEQVAAALISPWCRRPSARRPSASGRRRTRCLPGS